MNKHAIALLVLLVPLTSLAIDHNNVDAGRPLRFEDASPIAFGERTLEFGVSSNWLRRARPSYGLVTEFKYGLALDQELGIGLENEFSDGFSTNAGHVELRYLRQIKRDTESSPAFAVGFNVAAPYGDASGSTEFGVRGVISRQVGDVSWVHLNADLIVGDDEPKYGLLFGFSRPLGYPTDFSQTLVAELGVRRQGNGRWIGVGGVGVRRQLSPRSVLDYGVLVEGLGDGNSQGIKLNVGYSVSF